MQKRLQEILTNERLTPARFAELVGVQRSSVSHILSGRNKPSLDFLQKTLINFEHINPDWLISGNGPYKRPKPSDIQETSQAAQSRKTVSGRLNFPLNQPVEEEERMGYGKNPQSHGEDALPELEPDSNTPGTPKTNGDVSDFAKNQQNIPPQAPQKEVIKTILFYNDHTFEVFFPA